MSLSFRYTKAVIITYFGDQCFRVENGSTGVLVDPTSNRLKGNVVLRTVSEPEYEPQEPTDISFAGEYEVGGIEIQGFQIQAQSDAKSLHTIYKVMWEGVSLVFLGDLKEPLVSEIIDQVGEVDILFLPTGGPYLSTEAAVSLTKKIDPKMVIPYGPKSESEFPKKIGQSAETQEKLVFKKKDLVDVEQKIVILSQYGG